MPALAARPGFRRKRRRPNGRSGRTVRPSQVDWASQAGRLGWPALKDQTMLERAAFFPMQPAQDVGKPDRFEPIHPIRSSARGPRQVLRSVRGFGRPENGNGG